MPKIAEVLQGILGQRLVAFAIGERNPKRIGQLARDEATVSLEEELTLRSLAEVTDTLLEKENESEITVRALLVGANPDIGDMAMIELFHNGEAERVVHLARNWVS